MICNSKRACGVALAAQMCSQSHLMQLSIIAGAGLFDNVLSDYLWARAVLLIGKEAPQPIVLLNL